jgi:hypothetical protein
MARGSHLTELKPSHLTESHRALTLAASLAGPDGIVPLATLVRAMVAEGWGLRSAQGTLEMLSGRRLVVITERQHPSTDIDAEIELERGTGLALWTATKVLPPPPPRPPRKPDKRRRNTVPRQAA